MSNLDKEFKDYADQINLKIKEAAKIMEEINLLREKSGMSSFTSYNLETIDDEDYDDAVDRLDNQMEFIDFSPLFEELDRGGWSTSSMDCPDL